MALLKSIATGNFTASSTWGVAISVAENSPATSSTVTISTVNVSSESFTITSSANLTGILVKLIHRSSLSGTATFELFDSTASVIRATVTVNLADMPDWSGYWYQWMFIKFNTALTPANYVSGNNHQIRARTTLTNGMQLGTGGTTTTWSRAILTDTNATPAAGDTFVIVGEVTSTGSNSYTVTMDNTSSTKFGIPGQSQYTFGLYIGHNGTLTYGTNASTNYLLVINANVGIGIGGTLNIGTVATPMPRSSTGVLEIDNTTTSLSQGLSIIGGTLILQGQSRTAGNNSDRCLLTADAASGATSLTVDTDTGWLAGDVIGISRTERGGNVASETRTLSVNATANTLTLTSGLSAARLGDPRYIQAMVVLLTRNVAIRSANPIYEYAIGTGEIYRGPTSKIDADWAAFTYCNRMTPYSNLVADFNMNYCVINRGATTNTVSGYVFQGGVGQGFIMTNIIYYRSFFIYASSNAGNQVISQSSVVDNIWIIGSPITGPSFRASCNMSNIRAQGIETPDANTPTLTIADYQQVVEPTSPITYSNIHISGAFQHSVNIAAKFDERNKLTINNLTVMRGGTLTVGGISYVAGLFLNTCHNVDINNFRIWDCPINIMIYFAFNTRLRNGYIASSSTQTSTGIRVGPYTGNYQNQDGKVVLDNVIFGAGFDGAVRNDPEIALASYGVGLNASSSAELYFRNCFFSNPIDSTSFLQAQLIITETGKIYSDSHNLSPGNRVIIEKWGRVSSENTITYPLRIFSRPDLREGLVGLWSPASTGATGTDLFDLSGYNSKGVLTNMDASSDWVNYGKGWAIELDGNDDIIVFPTTGLPSGNSLFTCAFWFNWAGDGTAVNDFIFGYGPDVGTNPNCLYAAVDSSSKLEIALGSGVGLTRSTTILSTNVTYFGAGTYDGSQMKLWLNAVNEATTARSNNNLQLYRTSDNQNVGCIGALYSGFGNVAVGSPERRYGTFNGKVSELSFWNRALSSDEIHQLYTNGPGWLNDLYVRSKKARMLALTSTYQSLRVTYKHPPAPNFNPLYPAREFEFVFLKCAVNSGTTQQVGVKIRKSTALDGQLYVGTEVRLVVKRNTLIGISADTTIATSTAASNGSWETLLGSLPAITNNGVIEVSVVLYNTAGWINIKDAKAIYSNTLGLTITDDTLEATAVGNNQGVIRITGPTGMIG